MRARKKTGFTLIELLVVIAVIALLMAILAPSLNMAKEMARSVACNAHQRAAGIAVATYTSSWNDWLPGPNTSGLRQTKGLYVDGNSSGSTPVQNMDWISPTLGEELGLPSDRESRFVEICNTKFRCPSNKAKYDFEYNGGSGSIINTVPINSVYQVSFGASLAFHVVSYQSGEDNLITDEGMATNEVAAMVPRGYQPKISRVGSPSDKVFCMDGTRYVEAQPGGGYQVSINGFTKQIQGGNYMVYGPPTQFDGSPFKMTSKTNPKLVESCKKYGYRHRDKLNVTYFDGHTESLKFEESLDINLYWPRGSKVLRSSQTYDPDDRDRQAIK